MLDVSFTRRDNQAVAVVLRVIVDGTSTSQLYGDASMLDFTTQPFSQRLNRLIGYAENSEEWLRAILAGYNAQSPLQVTVGYDGPTPVPSIVAAAEQKHNLALLLALGVIGLFGGVLIIGILAAIALPTFVNQQDKAKDSAALQSLNVAYKVAKSEQAANGGFGSPQKIAKAIKKSEPQLNVVADPQATPGTLRPEVVTVQKASGNSLTMYYMTRSGKVRSFRTTNNNALQIQ
jgi:type II secretory pathway pseudopilin PulG